MKSNKGELTKEVREYLSGKPGTYTIKDISDSLDLLYSSVLSAMNKLYVDEWWIQKKVLPGGFICYEIKDNTLISEED